METLDDTRQQAAARWAPRELWSGVAGWFAQHETKLWWLHSVWALAFLGIFGKVAAYRQGRLVRSHRLSALLYLGLGWSGIALGWEVLEHLPVPALAWLVAGGLVYTLGAAIFLAHHIRYHHALWHVMVLAGSACHFWLVLSYVLPGSAVGGTL